MRWCDSLVGEVGDGAGMGIGMGIGVAPPPPPLEPGWLVTGALPGSWVNHCVTLVICISSCCWYNDRVTWCHARYGITLTKAGMIQPAHYHNLPEFRRNNSMPAKRKSRAGQWPCTSNASPPPGKIVREFKTGFAKFFLLALQATVQLHSTDHGDNAQIIDN